ncbi:RHS repeat protein [bacterium]|nr:RHS repeat protein [bacterium]
MNKKYLLTIFIILGSLVVFADSPVVKFDSIIQSDPRISFGKGIQEQVAPTSGELNVTYEAVSIGGVGIPINVFLNYNSNGVYPFNDSTLGQGAYSHLSINIGWDDANSVGSNISGTFFNEFGLTSELALLSEGMIEEIIIKLVGFLGPLGKVLEPVLKEIFKLIDVDVIDNTNAHTYLTQFTPQGCPIRGVFGGFHLIASVNAMELIQSAMKDSPGFYRDFLYNSLMGVVEYYAPPDNISVLYADGTTEPFKRNQFINFKVEPTTSFEYIPANPAINSKLIWTGAHYVYVTKDGMRYKIEPHGKIYVNLQFINEGVFQNLSDIISNLSSVSSENLISLASSLADISLYTFKFGLVTEVLDTYGNDLELEYCRYGLESITDSLDRTVTLHYNDSNDILRKDNPYRLTSIDYQTDDGPKSVDFKYNPWDTHFSDDEKDSPYSPKKIEIYKPIDDDTKQKVTLSFDELDDETIDTWLPGIIKDFEYYFRHLTRIDYATGGYVEYVNKPFDSDFDNRYYYRDMDLTKQRVVERKEYESIGTTPSITKFNYTFTVHDDWIVTGGLAYFPVTEPAPESGLGVINLGLLGTFVGGVYFTRVMEVEDGTVTRTDPNGHKTQYQYVKNHPGHYNHYLMSISGSIPWNIFSMSEQLGYYPSSFNIKTIIELPIDDSVSIVTSNAYFKTDDFVLDFSRNLLTDRDYKLQNSGRLKSTTVTRRDFQYGINYEYDEYGNTLSEIGSGAMAGYNKFAEFVHENPVIRDRYLEKGFSGLISRQWSYQNYDGEETPYNKMETRYFYDLSDFSDTSATINSGTSATLRGELNQVRQTDPDLGEDIITAMQYDHSSLYFRGMILKSIDPLENATEFSYSQNSSVITHEVTVHPEDGMNITTRKVFDRHMGRLLNETDPNGNTTEYTYDGLGRVTDVAFPAVDASANITHLTYQYDDTPGFLEVNVTDAEGSVNRYNYDGLGRLQKLIQDPGGFDYILENFYNRAGNLEKVKDSQGRETELFYDTYKRLEKIKYPDNTELTTEYFYNINSTQYQQTVKDANGTTTDYVFDGFDRLIEVHEPEDASAFYTYDDVGNLLTMTDPRSKVTTYNYNTLNQLTDTLYPDGTTEFQTYDLIGNVETKTDGNGKVNNYSYDDIYRLREILYPGTAPERQIKKVAYEYDDNGNRTKMIEYKDDTTDVDDVIGEISYTYNNRNWLTEDTRKYQGIDGTSSDGYTNTYEYNQVGDLTSTTYPGGKTVEYTVDKLHRTSYLNIKDETEHIADYAYNPMGTIAANTYGNGIVGTYSYDIRDRMTNLEYLNTNPEPPASNLLLHQQYKYDKVGNRTELMETDSVSGAKNKITEYSYDDLYRLTFVNHTERTNSYASYEYDPSGNRTFMHQDQGDFDYTIATDSNQLEKIISNNIGHTYLNYDDNGNLISEKEYKGTETEGIENYNKDFIWDYENRLMEVEITRKNDDTTKYIVSFAYNGDGQRIYKEVKIKDDSENETMINAILYVRNSFGEVVEEYEAKGTDDFTDLPTSSYIFGNGKRIMSITAEDTKTYYLSDILGSNSLLTDEAGNPTMLTKYDEFGNTYYEWRKNLSTFEPLNLSTNYGYTGKPLDKETGLYYYGARYYNPQWGRWVSRDLFVENIMRSQSLNRMIYVENNPLANIDPNGYWTMSLQGSAGAGIGIFIVGGGVMINLDIVADSQGNLGLQLTVSAGHIGGASIGAYAGAAWTSADTIYDLEGYSVAVGISGMLKVGGGGEFVFPIEVDFSSDRTGDIWYLTAEWWGFTGQGGAGIGIEGHFFYQVTETLMSTSIGNPNYRALFDEWEKLGSMKEKELLEYIESKGVNVNEMIKTLESMESGEIKKEKNKKVDTKKDKKKE